MPKRSGLTRVGAEGAKEEHPLHTLVLNLYLSPHPSLRKSVLLLVGY